MLKGLNVEIGLIAGLVVFFTLVVVFSAWMKIDNTILLVFTGAITTFVGALAGLIKGSSNNEPKP